MIRLLSFQMFEVHNNSQQDKQTLALPKHQPYHQNMPQSFKNIQILQMPFPCQLIEHHFHHAQGILKQIKPDKTTNGNNK